MVASSRYESMWCVNPANATLGYKNYMIPAAQAFFQKHIFNSQDEAIQTDLLSYFYAQRTTITAKTRAEAGLCLRCYVSASILKACRTLDRLFGNDKSFTYRDLLPFVLNDDGKTFVILDRDRKSQLVLIGDETPQTSAYQLFSVDVLRTFKAKAQPNLSLDSWTYLRTKQNAELRQFLAEFGFQNLSDWALLNRARLHQRSRLSERDCHLLDVFHAVYRRDRRQQLASAKRCPDPSIEQLQEMITGLQAKNVTISSVSELMRALKQLAVQLRQYDIWSYRVPLEVQDPDTGHEMIRSDLPNYHADELGIEQKELLMFLHEQLNLALNAGIVQELHNRVTALECSKKYAPLAPQFIPGLHLYYDQCLSLKKIAPMLSMTSTDQAKRVLNPGNLLSKVRALTVQQVLDRVLELAQKKGFAQTPPEPNYLRTLAEQVEAFVDQEIFQEAVEEIRAGQGRSFNSIYAQKLRFHLSKLMHKHK
ncbi:MAG: hypothetical protein ACFBSF_21230 [Leptolyngbyaceae cyanobacterium]